MEEDKKDDQVTEEAIVEVKAVSFKGLKENSSSSKDRRRNLTEKEEEDEDEIEGLETWREDELINGRLVDEVEEDGSSEEDILRAAAQMPFEEESFEEEITECTPHPFTKDIQE